MVARLSSVFATALIVSALPPAARAQEPAGVGLRAALARVPSGSTVRLQTTGGDMLEGMLRLAGDSVRLDGADHVHVVALADVRSAWLRQRRTRTGALVGSLLGGAGGGIFLGFLGLVAGADKVGELAEIGVLGGGLAGGVAGGVVGAAIPRWTPIQPDRAGDIAMPAPPDAAPGRRRLGAIEAAAGFGRIGGDEPTEGGPGGRLALHAEFGTDPSSTREASLFFSVGPEIGWFDLGSTGRVRRAYFDPSSPTGAPDTLQLARSYTALTAGGLLRLGLATSDVRAYALGGLAYHRWDYEQSDESWLGPGPVPPAVALGGGRFEHVGYSIGAGGQAALGRALAVTLELRRTAVRTFDMDLPGHYWSIALGLSRRW
jgi:hypothetical protein